MSSPAQIRIHVSVVIRDGDDQRILMVQEEKAQNRGRWNLPGGHLEWGETPQAGAVREVREETHLDARLTGLLGIYTTIRPAGHAIRFVFAAEQAGGRAEAEAGDQILAVRWMAPGEVLAMPDEQLVSPAHLRDLFHPSNRDRRYPLDLLHESRR